MKNKVARSCSCDGVAIIHPGACPSEEARHSRQWSATLLMLVCLSRKFLLVVGSVTYRVVRSEPGRQGHCTTAADGPRPPNRIGMSLGKQGHVYSVKGKLERIVVAITRTGKDLVGKSRRSFSVRPRCVEVGEKYFDGWTCYERTSKV